MKCNAIIIYKKGNGKKGKRNISFTIRPNASEEELKHFVNSIPERRRERLVIKDDEGTYFRCDGQIKANILAVEEPFMGGSTPTLDVKFICNKCGHRDYPGLPDEYSLNEWVNRVLSKME